MRVAVPRTAQRKFVGGVAEQRELFKDALHWSRQPENVAPVTLRVSLSWTTCSASPLGLNVILGHRP